MRARLSAQHYGKLAEDKALDFLQGQQLILLERNYRSPQGEIDLIMQDEDTVVFVEVRARQSGDFLAAVESIDTHKRRHIIKASAHYLQRRGIHADCRLDVITLIGAINEARINWIKNAFEAS